MNIDNLEIKKVYKNKIECTNGRIIPLCREISEKEIKEIENETMPLCDFYKLIVVNNEKTGEKTTIRTENIIIGSKDDIYNHLNETHLFKERNEQTSKLSDVNFDGYNDLTIKQQLDIINKHNPRMGLVFFLSQKTQGEETIISFKTQFVLIQDKDYKWDRDFYEVNRNT